MVICKAKGTDLALELLFSQQSDKPFRKGHLSLQVYNKSYILSQVHQCIVACTQLDLLDSFSNNVFQYITYNQ